MRSSVIVFPGSNCDRDIAVALEKMQFKNQMVWHKETKLPKSDLIVVPGGSSYGDYLRSGAIAGKSLIVDEVIKAANSGCLVLGICNGFQILTETGLLKGTLLRNKNLKFINKDVHIKVMNNNTKFLHKYKQDQILKINIAHNEGNFFTDKKFFFGYLSKIGYSIKNSTKIKKDEFAIFLISAFQRRFRQELINGKIDQECLLISENLAKKLN